MLPLLWSLGSVFLLIRSYKEDDIIPVLIGQQEGGGRRGAAWCVEEDTVSASCALLLLYSAHYFREVNLTALHPPH